MTKTRLTINQDEEGTFVYDQGEYIPLAYTVKKIIQSPNEVDWSEYVQVISSWEKFGNHVRVYNPYYEYDSQNILHIHGIMLVKKNFYKKRLQIKGFHVYTTDIYDLEKWKEYITKDQDNQLGFLFKERLKKYDNTQYMF